MTGYRKRSFGRDLFELICNIEENEQIHVLDYDGLSMQQFTLRITPTDGIYAHAEFLFRIESTQQYPDTHPDIRCLTPVFHPNITVAPEAGNTCINLINMWNRSFNLLDVANSILYLFYQPNFDDPLSSCVPADGETASECIRRAFGGGYVHDIYYPPNTAWCAWRDQEQDSLDSPKQRTLSDPQEDSAFSEHLRASLTDAETMALEPISPSPSTETEICRNEPRLSTADDQTFVCTIRPRYSINGSISQRSWRGSDAFQETKVSFNAFRLEAHDIQWFTESSDDDLIVRRYYFAETCRSSDQFVYMCGPHEDPRPLLRENGLLLTLQGSRSDSWHMKPPVCVPSPAPSVNDWDTHWLIVESPLTFKFTPLHWLLQQTRWPEYALPGYYITPCMLDLDVDMTWPRASALRLFSDLKRRTTNFSHREPLHLITIDPLTLSPFAPICNRFINTVLRNQPGENNPRMLLSVEWVSLLDSLIPPVTNANTRIYRFFGISTVLSSAFLSNWFGWMSRMELHQFSFGFTRPGSTAFSPVRNLTDSFALTCIYPPSLGCGQTAVFDAWPCVFVWQTCKLLTSALGRFFGFCTHRVYEQSNANPYRGVQRCGMCPTRVYFAFSDVDEI